MTIPNLSFLASDTDDPRDLSAALRESYELLALAEQSAGIGIWDRDLATDMVRATPTFFRLIGLEPSAVPVHADVIRAVRHPDDAAKVVDGFQQALAQGIDVFDSEYRIIRPSDGALRWIFGRGRIIRDAAERPVRYSGIDIDITERKRAEEEIRLLMHEVNHRANNLLAVVLAIARQTVDSGDARAYAERLSQRIAGIAASNNLLVSGNWNGVEIARLVESQLAPFAATGERLTIEGPAMKLAASAAQAVGMALHELATNAVKYGALSGDRGRVRIAWSLTGDSDGDRVFSMGWSEHDGPPVAPPQRTGFGQTVVERMVSGTLGGNAKLEFAPEGVTWTFTCPAHQALEVED